MEKIASLLQPDRRRSWRNGQTIALTGAVLLIGLLLTTELEVIDRLRVGGAAYTLARIFEGLALAGLLGLGFAVVLACRESDRMRAEERRLRAEAASEARRSQVLLDDLTELPNGQALVAVLKETIERAPKSTLAFYLLDLDGFRSVNVAYGSSIGDAIIRIVALRLRGVVRRDDLIARLESDSFAVIVRGVASRQEAMVFGQRYAATLDNPIRIEDRDYTIGITIGAAFYPDDGATPGEFLRRADEVLRAEKARRRIETVYAVALTSAPAV